MSPEYLGDTTMTKCSHKTENKPINQAMLSAGGHTIQGIAGSALSWWQCEALAEAVYRDMEAAKARDASRSPKLPLDDKGYQIRD